jgi:hypothetical protein
MLCVNCSNEPIRVVDFLEEEYNPGLKVVS